MTWKSPLSIAQLRRAWRVLAFAAPLAGILASIGFIALPAPDPQPRCAVLFARSLASVDAPVRGSFACLDAGLQSAAAAADYDGDEGLQRLAGEPPIISDPRFVGQAGSGWIYDFAGSPRRVITIWVDEDGRVSDWSMAHE